MKRFPVGLLALTCTWGTGETLAAQISTSYSFNSTTSWAAPANASLIGVSPFDGALGTLNTVDVSVSGSMALSLLTAYHPWGYLNAPVGAAFTAMRNQRFVGTGGQFFAFDLPARFLYVGMTGFATSHSYNETFSYSFSFDGAGANSLSLVSSNGFGASLPASISGTAAGFQASAHSNGLAFLDSFSTTGGLPYDLQGFTNTVTGTISVVYDYTPRQPGHQIPEPASLALLGLGLAALGFSARRKA